MDGQARERRQRCRSVGARLALAALACLAAADAVAQDCTVGATGVAFGVYDPSLATPTDSVGNVNVRCTHTGGPARRIAYTVALSAGSSGSFARRTMRAGAAGLDYNLFNSVTRLQVWGNGTGGSALVGGSLVVNPGAFAVNQAAHPIYGRIPAQQSPAPGSYTDTILVTLTF